MLLITSVAFTLALHWLSGFYLCISQCYVPISFLFNDHVSNSYDIKITFCIVLFVKVCEDSQYPKVMNLRKLD